jgi:hypothetical protein
MFPGTSCFPESPIKAMLKNRDKHVNIVGTKDQLKLINDLLGGSDPQDLSFLIDDEKTISYQL